MPKQKGMATRDYEQRKKEIWKKEQTEQERDNETRDATDAIIVLLELKNRKKAGDNVNTVNFSWKKKNNHSRSPDDVFWIVEVVKFSA